MTGQSMIKTEIEGRRHYDLNYGVISMMWKEGCITRPDIDTCYPWSFSYYNKENNVSL